MSGHRRGTGKGTRAQERAKRFLGLLAAAPTIEAELNVAMDWWRSAARAQADRDTRITMLARQLANDAHAMDGGAR